MARRLDESNWRPMHTRIAAALGIGWMVDAFEVQIIGSVIPGIQAEFNLDGRQAVLITSDSAYPTFSEIFPTDLRATGIGASVRVGRMGAVLGQIVLAEAYVIFVVLGLFWLIGAGAGALWWLRGIEARGLSVDVLGMRSADIRAGLSR